MTTPVPKSRSLITDNLGQLLGAGVLLFWDLGIGEFALSIIACPIWFLATVMRRRIAQTERRTALFRAAVPVVTLGIVIANTFLQLKIADINGTRIIRACESYHSDNGRNPKTLNELVPRYLPSVPPARYCMNGDFHYYNASDSDGHPPMLSWDRFVFQHNIYSFDRRGWHTLD